MGEKPTLRDEDIERVPPSPTDAVSPVGGLATNGDWPDDDPPDVPDGPVDPPDDDPGPE